MMKQVVEFCLIELQNHLYHFQDGLTLIKQLKSCETFIYAIFEEDPDSLDPFQKHLRSVRVTFDNYEELAKIDQVIWTLARHCEPADYWLVMDLTPSAAEYWLQQGVLTSSILVSNHYDWMNSEILLKLSQGQTLPLDPRVATLNHAHGFHFFALPTESSDNKILEDVYRSIQDYKLALRDVIWNTDIFLADTVLEVRPYGEEDCDHVGIKLTSTLTREHVRQVVREIYQLPYQIITLSDKEFIEWQDNGRIDLSQHNH